MYKIFLYIFLLNSLIITYVGGYGQKPLLDYPAIENWPDISYQTISSDGKFVCYTVTELTKPTLHIKSLDGSFHKEVPGLPGSSFYSIQFTENSRKCIFTKPGDSLCIVDLYAGSETVVPNCNNFNMSQEGNSGWLAYLLNNKSLILNNLNTGESFTYANVVDFSFSKTGKVIVINVEDSLNSSSTSLVWLDLINNKSKTIWKGAHCGYFSLDKSENQLAFCADGTQRSIWYYDNQSENEATLLVDENAPTFKTRWRIKYGELRFSPKGDKLFFDVTPLKTISKVDSNASHVDVWNYKDEQLQEAQLLSVRQNITSSYLSVINLINRKIVILKKEGDDFYYFLNEGNNDDYLLVIRSALVTRNVGIADRKTVYERIICIVNTDDGSRNCFRVSSADFIRFSPAGKYVLWYDGKKRGDFIYNLKRKTVTNISNQIKYPIYNERWNFPAEPPSHQPQPVWFKNDEALLIYDRYDIWKVDPLTRRPPINITKGYGRKNKTLLRCLYYDINYDDVDPIIKEDTLFLAGFNEVNKNNCFFKLNMKGEEMSKLTSGPLLYYFPKTGFWRNLPVNLTKAKSANVFLLKRQGSTEYPNLVTTTDFAKFNGVSELAPQKNVNWLRAELLNWKTFDGRLGQGILYKPEDFDPKKKYPIIFYFYEEISNSLNIFPTPELSYGALNISYYVSNGYLVFSPDVFCKVGMPGEAYNYVVSAAKMLSQKTWVDAKRMGIQGHSFGGYEVNYLITRTKMFSAASSAAGASDLISFYGTLHGDGQDGQNFVELGQQRMSVPLWKDKQRYISYSPLFGADKVTTPLLLMNNKNDIAVNWTQGVEYFTGLRRLNKPVWMLQYDDGAHILTNRNDQLDYSIRLSQFFDHYLKGLPAPKWMTQGIPANMKGVDNGFALDPVK